MTAFLLALWCALPSDAIAQSIVPVRNQISSYQARHLLARLYSYSDTSLRLAESEFRQLLRQTPDDQEVSLELAEVLTRMGRDAEADALFRSLDQKDPRVAAGLGDTLFASGRMAEAAEAYNRAREAGSQRADLTLRLAQSLSWSGQAVRALPFLEKLHTANPSDVDMALLYAQALSKNGEGEKARLILDQVAASAPNNPGVLLALADMEAEMGHIRAVRQYSLKAVSIDNTPQTRLRLAQNMNMWGAFHRSIALQQEFLATNGPDPKVSLSLAEALSNAQRYEEAEGELRELLIDTPDNQAAHLALVGLKLQEKDGTAALASLSGMKTTPEVETLRARALELLGRDSESVAVWRQLANDNLTNLIEQGRMLVRAGDSQAATEAFSMATRLAPNSPEAHYYSTYLNQATNYQEMAQALTHTETEPVRLSRWAQLFSRDGHYDAAIICLEAALKIDAEYFPARMALAENLAYARHYDAALVILKQLETEYPDSSKIVLTHARVLAWDRRYDEAIAMFETLHDSDPKDPVPVREMARAEFWNKHAEQGQSAFARLLEPPVDAVLAQRLEAKQTAGNVDPMLAKAVSQARQSADNGGIYQAYGDLADTAIAREYPQLFAELLPSYRIQQAAVLESRAKYAAYDRRFVPAMDDLVELTNLHPGNEEAWFDLGQTQCALGLCTEEAATYERLLEIDPQHTLAERAIERRKRRDAPWMRAGVNLWEEKGHGNLANIVRLRNDLQVSLPVEGGLRFDATAHRWQEMPQSPSKHYEALGGTLGMSGVVNEWLSGQVGWTAKRFGTAAPEDTDQYRARLEFNLRDAARVGVGYERSDEVANLYSLLSGTQSDNFIIDARVPVTRRFDMVGGYKHINYNDDNSGEAAHLIAEYALTDHPRLLKIALRGEYRHTRYTSVEVYTAGELTDIVHPYWTPQGYRSGSVSIEWKEDLAEDYFCGAEQHFLDFKLTGGTDSDANNSIQFEAEWVREFANHWGVEVRGLWHRSQQWDANGLWAGVRYGF